MEVMEFKMGVFLIFNNDAERNDYNIYYRISNMLAHIQDFLAFFPYRISHQNMVMLITHFGYQMLTDDRVTHFLSILTLFEWYEI